MIAVLLFLFSSYALGRVLFPSEKLLAVLLGIAVWQFVVTLAVRVPINYPAVYLIALAIPLLMRPRLAQECLLLLKPRSWLLKEYLALSLVLFFATVYLLAALMPEVSADGLAMHLAIPGFVANHHYWHFDVDAIDLGRYADGGQLELHHHLHVGWRVCGAFDATTHSG